MRAVRKTIHINAPVEEVFEFVTHPENLPTIWPSLIEVKNATRSDEGAVSFDWTYKMAGMKFRGHAETPSVERNRRAVVRNEKGIPSTFTWAYQSVGPNECTVTLEVEYEIPGKILRALAEPIIVRLNDREMDTMLHNLKSTTEELTKAAGKERAEQPPAVH